MKRTLLAAFAVIALTMLMAGAVQAEDVYSDVGIITSATGNAIVFLSEGESITLKITGDTIIIGQIRPDVRAYVEWSGDNAVSIEVDEAETAQ